jgi:hypothetical protein
MKTLNSLSTFFSTYPRAMDELVLRVCTQFSHISSIISIKCYYDFTN